MGIYLLTMAAPDRAVPKGAIVEARVAHNGYSTGEVLPDFVRIYCDVLLHHIEAYEKRWVRVVDWVVVGSDLSIDGHRLRLSATNPGASGSGRITREMVRDFLDDWKFNIVSAGSGTVTVDILVYDALTSRGFFDHDLIDIAFTELSYDQPSGVHQIQADYSANPAPIGRGVDRRIRELGGTIISHSNKIVVYEMDRADAVARLKAEFKSRFERSVAAKRYHIAESVVDAAIAAGGELTLTPAQLMNAIEDQAA